MSRKNNKSRKPNNKRSNTNTIFITSNDGWKELCGSGYVALDKNPEIIAGCNRIAELIASMTIHLMSNTDRGDERIINELSRKVDIEPISTMTRKAWMSAIVMNLLLYGDGNSIVIPHTRKGFLQDLEPIAAERVGYLYDGYSDYQLLIDGKAYDHDDVLHFTLNQDKTYLWKGQGFRIALHDVAEILKQAHSTEKSFMESKFMPSLIIKVDALTDEFSSPEGRERLVDEYVTNRKRGEPWMIPAEQFSVEQVKPLTLADLAINDTVQIDKRTVASILGIPPFVLGVGEYHKDAWNSFISNTIRPIAKGIEQELTRKLLLSPKWYFRFNIASLMDYDLQTLANVFGQLSDRGFVTGNEVRDRIGMSPLEGLDELRVLENYIPYDMAGLQKKLVQGGE
jgi:HK97 family phage portal protein